jgi:heme/copper-type cytochrome/quinol oxidase subunit 2
VWQSMGNGWQWFWMMALMCAIWLVVVVGAFFVLWASRDGRHDARPDVPTAEPVREFSDATDREEVLSGSR